MIVTIDKSSGFCWGVVRTIEKAEETLANTNENVYILGQIIHNPHESSRLEAKGLKTISHQDLEKISQEKNAKVLIRAHGEPPSTYKKAAELGIDIVDATCPLVTSLQKRVEKFYKDDYQIVIYGKKEHAEIIGLRGVCNDECIVIKTVEEALEKVDFSKKTVLISQTTMERATFYKIKEALEERVKELIDGGEVSDRFTAKDTLCKAVYGREDKLKEFAKSNDVVIFVAGRNSSNGKSLFHICQDTNPRSYFIEDISELNMDWFEGAERVGITGATSTPQWYMENVKEKIEQEMSSVLV
ncbi:MAG: 4-hydroxy-3-methylbut-2-enyl diphosphate reductase [Candidatus Kapabacteria bacterium]|nr:4-hydroxy-3-methylbut-2-enyl diphosphate reductase [Candidatus Kapabacteria bacterium]